MITASDKRVLFSHDCLSLVHYFDVSSVLFIHFFGVISFCGFCVYKTNNHACRNKKGGKKKRYSPFALCFKFYNYIPVNYYPG